MICAKEGFELCHNCWIVVSKVGIRPLTTDESHLQTCPVTWAGGSDIPSDGTGSLAEGAGLIGCDGGPSSTDGLLLYCLGFRGLGELPCWLPSGGGEGALKLKSLALDDTGREGRAVRNIPVSSLSTGMAVDFSCLLSAMLTARSHFPPPKGSRWMRFWRRACQRVQGGYAWRGELRWPGYLSG